jgi:hypothetical protein
MPGAGPARVVPEGRVSRLTREGSPTRSGAQARQAIAGTPMRAGPEPRTPAASSLSAPAGALPHPRAPLEGCGAGAAPGPPRCCLAPSHPGRLLGLPPTVESGVN